MKNGEAGGMGSPVFIMLAVFALLALVMLTLLLGLRSKQRSQVARYAGQHGLTVLENNDAQLKALLDQALPEERWVPQFVLLVQQTPRTIYLFGYQGGRKATPFRTFLGTGVLALDGGRAYAAPVEIEARTPGVEPMMDDQVEAGSDEFRGKFTVVSKSAGDACAIVNERVERMLMASTLPLRIVFAGREVLVSSREARTDQDWEYLVGLAKQLRDAI